MRLHRRSQQFPNFTVARHVSRPRIGRTPLPPGTKHERPGDPIEFLESQIHPRQSIMESTAHAISRYRGRPTRTRPGTCILFLLGYKGTRALSATGLLFMGRKESDGAWVYLAEALPTKGAFSRMALAALSGRASQDPQTSWLRETPLSLPFDKHKA